MRSFHSTLHTHTHTHTYLRVYESIFVCMNPGVKNLQCSWASPVRSTCMCVMRDWTMLLLYLLTVGNLIKSQGFFVFIYCFYWCIVTCSDGQTNGSILRPAAAVWLPVCVRLRESEQQSLFSLSFLAKTTAEQLCTIKMKMMYFTFTLAFCKLLFFLMNATAFLSQSFLYRFYLNDFIWYILFESKSQVNFNFYLA